MMFYRILFKYPDGTTMRIIIPTIHEIAVQQFLSMERFKYVGPDLYEREDGTRAAYALDVDGLVYPPEDE